MENAVHARQPATAARLLDWPSATGAAVVDESAYLVTNRREGFPAVSRHQAAAPKAQLRIQLLSCVLVLDMLALAAGFTLANFARFGSVGAGPGLALAFAIAPIFAALAFAGRAYSTEVLQSPRAGIKRALKALLIAGAAVLMTLFYAKTAGQISRLVYGSGLLVACGLLISIRHWFGGLVGRRHKWRFVNEVLLVDGLTVLPAEGQIIIFAQDAGFAPGANDPGSFDRLGRMLANSDRVILATTPDKRRQWTTLLKCVGIPVEVLTPELDNLGPLKVRRSDHGSAVLVSVGPLGTRDRLLKRAFDLTVASALLVVSAPIMLVAALAVRLTSSGPVFFRQQRMGEGNRIFEVLKFRTMHVKATDSNGSRSASRDDDRITPVGKFLRRTSIDELPQLLNVLKGDMSVVGPRPHALASRAGDGLFWEVDDRYWQRGAIRPGITGLAQIRGHRGATPRREDLLNRVQADLEYLVNWSLLKDLGIILRTAKVMVHANAF